ncbi:hypothetical protein GCM10023319_33610 [Nocardia iowensis]
MLTDSMVLWLVTYRRVLLPVSRRSLQPLDFTPLSFYLFQFVTSAVKLLLLLQSYSLRKRASSKGILRLNCSVRVKCEQMDADFIGKTNCRQTVTRRCEEEQLKMASVPPGTE